MVVGAEASISVQWLGWERPILQSTIDYLLDRYRDGRFWDLERVVCVFPSSMAARRLSELLAGTAHEKSLVLRPPEIITSGALPEQLYQAKFPFASDMEQRLCWTKVLRKMPADVLKPLLIDVPPSNVTAPWVELAGLLSSLHRELSSDLTMFDDVANLLKKDLDRAPEVERWMVLAKIQRAYLDELHRAELWDRQTARRYAIEKKEPKTDSDIVVVGAVDLNRAQLAFLDAIHERVTILIGAPKSWSAGFDRFGTLRSGFWQDLPVELEPEQLVTRTTADEAAAEVTRQLAYMRSKYSAQEVTLGMPDASMVPIMTERLQRVGIAARNGAGVTASQSSPVRLLRAIVEYLESGTFESLASLVRLPIVFEWLTREANVPFDYIQHLDRYYQATLIRSVNIAQWPNGNGGDVVQKVHEQLNSWLQPLRLPARALNEWVHPLREVLSAAYRTTKADLESSAGAALADACSLVSQAVTHLSDLPDTLSLESTLKEAVGWVIQQIDKETIPPLRDPNSIEMIGWLDLSLDDAPVLILTGIHDGTVPESVNGDAFLPNTIRTQLGLMDNSRRYARDCYSLHVLLRSRTHLRIVTNHLNVKEEPQTPSRLLLAVHPNELAKRVMSLIKPPTEPGLPSVGANLRPRPLQSNVPIPIPIKDAGRFVKKMSPTDFKAYIDCPYRFYLSKILRLSSIDDRQMELEADDFGNLLHDTLAKLNDPIYSISNDATNLRVWLFEQLNKLAGERYGSQPPPVVLLQLEQARQRLAAFAALQANRAKEGWIVWKTEVAIDLDAKLVIDMGTLPPMPLIGRIDRIDFHPETKLYAIWDYKTSDAPVKPLAAHWSKSAGWKQLQLPLYRQLVKGIKLEKSDVAIDVEKITLGYINLPRAADKTEFALAVFADGLEATAIDSAREVVRQIRDNVFWPPKYDGIGDWDIFRGLCQHNVSRRWDWRLEAGIPDALEGLKSAAKPAAAIKKTPPPKAVEPKPSFIDVPPESIGITFDTTSGSAPREWFDRTLIKASAGTGKTFGLAIRMIRLLFANQPPDGILATTFTRKAAGEILERVLSLLAEAIETQEGLEKLVVQLSPVKINRQSCIHHLSKLCANLHRLRVSTLDGFYSELARTFAIELKLPPGWTLADEFQTKKLQDQAITRLFENQDRTQLRTLISQLNRGESKRSIRQEIIQTIDNGYTLFLVTQPEAWSNLTVPKEPAESIVSAVISGIKNEKTDYASLIKARDKMLELFAQAEWDSFLQLTLVINAPTLGKYNRVAIPQSFIEGIAVLTQYAISKEFASRRAQSEAAYQLLANYHLQFDTVKRSQRLVTFTDVSQRLSVWFKALSVKNSNIAATADLKFDFEKKKATEDHLLKVGHRLDSRIDHLLLDEFQDTSPMQWDILAPFAEAVVDPAEGRSTSFFCVGDVKQAIYGWRGGVAELFNVVRHQLKDIKDDSLTKSYRSSQVVIDFVNQCFLSLTSHGNLGSCEDAARIWSGAFPTHATTKTNLPGYVRIWNTAEKTKASYGSEESADDEEDLSQEAVDQCIRDVATLHRAAPHVSIGILVRTNRELGPLLHRLREAKVEASQEGGNPLDDSAAVELLLSLIQLADHPGDRLAAFHIEQSPLAVLLNKTNNRKSKAASTNVSPNATDEKAYDPDWIAAERCAVEVRKQLDADGYGKTLALYAKLLAPQCSLRDQQRIDQLIQSAYSYDLKATLRGRDFIEFVRDNRVALNRPVAVRVMTIHQSKGLEFDAVFLPGLKKNFLGTRPTFVTRQSNPIEPPLGVMRYVNDKLQSYLSEDWQTAYRQQTIREFSEALSTFYVALTRAKQALYLYAQPSKSPLQRWDSLLQSIFVAESDRTRSEAIVYEAGLQDWYGAPESQAIPEGMENVSALPTELILELKKATAKDFVRQRTTLKPSATTESRTMSLTNLFEPSESIGAIVGTLVHRWFEEVIWLDDFQWERDAMRALALRTLTPQQMPLIRMDDWLTAMEAYLKSHCVVETLSRRRYADWKSSSGEPLELHVTNERRLLELLDGSLLRGTIDRLIVGIENGSVVRAEILDYKTDSLKKGANLEHWIKERIDHHAPQLRLYRRVLGKQFQMDESKIAMTLILLSGDRQVSIEEGRLDSIGCRR